LERLDIEKEEGRVGGDWIVRECDGFVRFVVKKIIDEDKERVTIMCSVVEAWARKDYWDGRRFLGEGLVFRGGGQFGS
jgi:hypothetical protein